MSSRVVQNTIYSDTAVTFALFKNVGNAKELRKSVMSGEFEAALLKPSIIVDPFQVIAAANRAVHLHKINKMMTKNVHSEILFSLSPSKNISDSFRKFGLADTDTSVLIAIVNDTDGNTLKVIQNLIKGEMVDMDEVSNMTDLNSIKKVYKLTDQELSVSSLADAIVSRIASKEIVTL